MDDAISTFTPYVGDKQHVSYTKHCGEASIMLRSPFSIFLLHR